MPIEEMKKFLVRAHHNTYANVNAPKTEPLRPSLHDYHFEESDFIYHDTYFGGKQFLGEEIIYWNGKPLWGMNYYGRGLLEKMPESYFDASLRPALMAEPWEKLPIRGPEHFTRGEYKYTMTLVEGTLECFSVLEQISLNGNAIFETFLHGGIIV